MNTNAGLWITGTDTGVGKTHVTAALVAALRAAGVLALPGKPIQTGARRGRSPDLDFILRLNRLRITPELYARLAPVRLPLAASPHLAARHAGLKLRIAPLIRAIHELQHKGVIPVLEGVGGILVLLNARETLLDLMQAMPLPVILVARPGLGTLNHTLLSAHALDGAGLTLAAVVLSRTGSWGAIEKDNLLALRQRLTCPVLAFPLLKTAHLPSYIKAGRTLLAALDSTL
jgi:dethiobiotin synthetase